MNFKSSWVESANSASTDFPLNNLPYGIFSIDSGTPRCGVAIGDMILDVAACEQAGMIALGDDPLLQQGVWNPVMEADHLVWARLRERLEALLTEGSPEAGALRPMLVAQADAQMHMPFKVTEYTDFYSGKNHAFNVGSIMRGPENALPANWLSIPIGYNGRASSVVVSGTPVIRPWGQVKSPDNELPHMAPSARFDLELEMGAIIGRPSKGMVSVAQADDMIFGFVLLNDWSARDIQAWEYQPLGPFQAKATATSISPWIVTKTALEPFRASTPKRERPLLPYLDEPGPMLYDVDLEVALAPEGAAESIVTRTNFSELYYSPAQQLCHHTTSGCAMRTGDLLGSGTISGTTKGSRGSLIEMSLGGKEPFVLPTGQTRSFLEDGDTLTIRGAAKGKGYRIGFGACTGTIMPAVDLPDWAAE